MKCPCLKNLKSIKEINVANERPDMNKISCFMKIALPVPIEKTLLNPNMDKSTGKRSKV